MIVDGEKLENQEVFVLGYFTLALKSLTINNEKVSASLRKEMDGFAKSSSQFETFLIGQLGRNDLVTKNDLSGRYILDMAISFIIQAQKYVGGRIIMIDCEDNENIIKFYQSNGFVIIQKHNTKFNLMQMIKVI